MRMTPALLVTTLAVSTASVALPVVSMPGSGPHAVAAEVVDLAFGRADLTDRQLPADVTGVAQRLLTAAAYTKKPFSMVGLTWDAASAPDPVSGAEMPFELSIRTRQGHTWTPWEELHADDDAPDSTDEADLGDAGTGAARAGTAPVWVGRSDALQVRLDRVSGALPTGLRALAIDPGSSAADSDVGAPQVASQAHAAIAWPTIHRRREWGANERMRGSAPRYNDTIKGGFVHHTAGTNNYSPADVPKIIRGIYAFHVRGRGWSDVGYNFLVDKFGRIWEGRAGGVERAVLGAHTGGFNRNTFGVAAIGNFERVEPPPAMVASIAKVFAWKFAMYGNEPGLDPATEITLTSQGGGTSRYRAGKRADFLRISGHRDAGETACPGKRLFAQLPTIRTLVETILDTQSTHGPAFRLPVSDGRGSEGGTTRPEPAEPVEPVEPAEAVEPEGPDGTQTGATTTSTAAVTPAKAAVRSAAAKSDATESDAVKPDAAKPDAAKPDAAKSDPTAADAAADRPKG